jgi:putative acetyltransferase
VVRAYIESNLEAVVSCFGQSVREIGARFYAPNQIAVWAPDPPDMEGWAGLLRAGGVFVADVNGAIAGFVRVEDNGFVDLLYVHPNHERGGVGRELLEAACSWVVSHGAHSLESEVSIAARPLFEAMGFRVERERSVERRRVRFLNFRMTRKPFYDSSLISVIPNGCLASKGGPVCTNNAQLAKR